MHNNIYKLFLLKAEKQIDSVSFASRVWDKLLDKLFVEVELGLSKHCLFVAYIYLLLCL